MSPRHRSEARGVVSSNRGERGASGILLALLALLAGACGSPPVSTVALTVPPPVPASTAPAAALGSGAVAPAALPPSLPPSPIPVLPDDAAWGDPAAPVRIVAFLDLQCPFSARVQPTLKELRERYGPSKIHLVWKHRPLPFHPQAPLGARAARAVHQVAGMGAFERFVDSVYGDYRNIDVEHVLGWAEAAGASRTRVAPLLEAPAIKARVDEDNALADRIGALGTPTFLVNGTWVTGAQPLEAFTAVVDRELEAAAELLRTGTPAAAISATRTRTTFQPKPPRLPSAPEEDPKTVWKVPVGTSPVLGKADALVTIVSFQNLECPFCKKVQVTLAALRVKYGDDLRIVFKHNPLPFHKRAVPAAMLVLEARAQKGDAAFFQAVERTYESQPKLEDADLVRIAGELGLDVPRVRKAIATERHAAVTKADQELAMDFNARGTPSFFINGRHLSGSQPLENFEALVDVELAKARSLVAQGTPRASVYTELMKTAIEAPAPEKKAVRSPGRPRPARGPSGAPITIEVFGDLECPFTRRVLPTLDALEQRYPGKLRFVFRHLPLDFHVGARMAAEAALEAQAQKGDAAGWKIVPLILSGLGDQTSLTDDELAGHAMALGLDVARFRQALKDGRHRAAVDDDLKAAADAGIRGTPSFVINGYFMSGAQPLEAFSKLIDRALREARPPVK